MALRSVSQNLINSVFSLGKGKSGKFSVGEWVNQALMSVDGSNRRLATKKDKTQWKHFAETVLVEVDKGLKIGSTHYVIEDEKPVSYLVICQVPSNSDKFNYYVGK